MNYLLNYSVLFITKVYSSEILLPEITYIYIGFTYFWTAAYSWLQSSNTIEIGNKYLIIGILIQSFPTRISLRRFIQSCTPHKISLSLSLSLSLSFSLFNECPRGVMVKAMDCRIVVSVSELQSRYYVHFRTNTLGKGMNPLILPAMG